MLFIIIIIIYQYCYYYINVLFFVEYNSVQASQPPSVDLRVTKEFLVPFWLLYTFYKLFLNYQLVKMFGEFAQYVPWKRSDQIWSCIILYH